MKIELKNLRYSSLAIALSKVTIFAKKCCFLKRGAGISKIKGFLVQKGKFPKTKYAILTSFGQGVTALRTAKQTPKEPTQIGVKLY